MGKLLGDTSDKPINVVHVIVDVLETAKNLGRNQVSQFVKAGDFL